VILSTLDRPNQAMLIWPQTRIIVPAAGLLGLVVAGMIVLGMVYLDDAIRSPADVQRYLELPLVGSVPRQRATALAKSKVAKSAESGSPTEMEMPRTAAQERL